MSVGEQFIKLDEGDVLLVSHDLPVASKITRASAERPYQALIFSLDLSILRGLYEQVGEAASNKDCATSLSASKADPAWTKPMVRYLELMNAPMDAQVLGPMILKEIHYRLLLSPIGGMLQIFCRWTAVPAVSPNPFNGSEQNFGNRWLLVNWRRSPG
jgi:hypothetical protein